MRDGTATAHKAKRRAAPVPTAQPAAGESRTARWAIPAVVALLTVVAFLPVLQNGFVAWDDDKNFVENPHFRGLRLEQLHWMWTTFHMGHYVPLSWMTLGFDYELWGMNPTGYHLTNLLLHAGSAVVVYFLARTILQSAKAESPEPTSKRLDIAAAFSALFFAIHPLRVESVAWATERRDVLSGLFYFSSILAYFRSRRDAPSQRRYWAAIALFVCALLSKATSMSIPAVLLVLNVYPLRRLGWNAGWWNDAAKRVYAELVPFAVLAAAIALLSIVALHPPSQLGVIAKLAVSAYSLVFYLVKTVAPVGLAPLYEMPQHVVATEARFIGSVVVVLGLAVAAWLLRRRWPSVTVALVLFFVVTLPMLGVVQNGPQIAADRYTYFGAPALAVLLGAAFLALPRAYRRVASGAATIIIVVLCAFTWEQSSVWHDSESLWSRVLDVDSESSIAHSAMSNVLYRENRVDEAIAHSKRAVAIAPNYPEALNGLGVGLARQGRLADAIEQYRRALAIRPNYDDAEANWGVTLVQQNDIAGAIEHYRRALEINPDNSNAQVNWGNALVRLNRFDEAVSRYDAAVRIRPDNADAQLNWGVSLARQGKYAAAIEHFHAALSIDQSHAEAREYLEQATRLLQAQARPN